MLKLIAALFIIVFLPKSLYSQDSFNLDEFSEGLDIGDESIAPTTTEVKSKEAAPKAVESPDDEGFEKISVTGSHIKRVKGEGPSPVFTVDRAMLDQSGHNSVSDVLRDMTSSSFGGMREASGSNAAGVSSANIRGLGADKTLVLLNGKRLPKDAVTGSVDMNLIPMSAVKRIEVLKDGASATYGSDALGGVINIITYKDYIGSSLSYQQAEVTQFEGGSTKQADMITGSATSKGFVTTILSYRENETYFDKDRPWSDEGVSISGSPGSYLDDDGVWKADTTNCDPDDIVDGGLGNEFCGFKYSDYSTGLPELKQINLMSLFEYEVNSDLTFYGRINATKKKIKWQYAPAPGVFSIDAATASTMGIPGYAGGDVTLRYRAVELGNRVTEVDTYALGFQTGFKGTLTDTWDWDFSFDRNTVYKNDLGVSGYGLQDKIDDLIESGSFNPFDYSDSRGDLSSAAYEPWQLSRSENNFYELKFSGELFETSSGAASAAIGASATQEKFSTRVDKLSEEGKVFGSAGSSGGGERETKSFYIETITPLAKGLELQLAGRYDEFSDFGNTTNPKFGLSWNVTNTVMLRMSAGTGFKAPQLKDLYAADSDGYPSFIDHVACENEKQAGGSTPSCLPQQWRVLSGGNEDLEEEKSESYNIGIVYQPSRRSMLSLDVWQTKLNNVVGVNYEKLTEYEQSGGNLADLGIEVERDASGRIDYINAPLLNLASLEISGVDLEIKAALSNAFMLKMQHSHLFYYKNEGFPGTGFEDELGENGFPAWRNNISLTYSSGSIGLTLIAKTIGNHKSAIEGEEELPVYTEYDLNYSQTFGRDTTLTVGVQNLLATEPPVDGEGASESLNTSLYNPRGQMVFAGLKQRF